MRRPSGYRHAVAQHLAHRLSGQPEAPCRPALAQPLHIDAAPHLRIELHSIHPFRVPQNTFGMLGGPRLPPGYRRTQPVRCPKLDDFTEIIDQILRDDQHRPKKQRHTAKRICERLRAEHAFRGGYTIVQDSVRAKRLGGQEMFVPLAHPPGHAQVDFGEADAIIAGVKLRAHFFAMSLPHSDACFIVAYPRPAPSFCSRCSANAMNAAPPW